MARKYALTWHKPTKRWRKRYKGKDYYFPFGESKTDADGYKSALESWQHLKGELDGRHAEEIKKAVEQREQILEWYNDADIGNEREYYSWDTLFRDCITDDLEDIEKNQEKEKPLSLAQLQIHVDPLFGESEDVKAVWHFRVPNLGRPDRWEVPQQPAYLTAGRHIDSFLALQKARAKSDQITVAHFQTVKTRLEQVRAFLGDTPVKQLGGPTITAFHKYLLEGIEQRRFSPIYARHLMAELRKFVKWLYSQEVIERLPPVLLAENRQFDFHVSPKPITTFSIPELHQLLKNASERTRLYLLLMMNTGMTQGDIAELRQSDVDWQIGKITRKRTKTRRHEAVPTVSYKLWKPTLALLRKHRSSDRQRVLLNENGQPLKFRQFRDDGRAANIDNIAKAYERLTKKLKLKKRKPLKLIRKTSASLLETHDTFARYISQFLGHAPQTIADRHYVKPSDEQFDKAIEWLGEQYQIDTLESNLVQSAKKQPKKVAG